MAKASTEGTPMRVPVKDLMLDQENPRLASRGEARPTEEEIIRVLWSEMAVDEVAFSIAANGYYEQEPLFVLKNTRKNEKPFIVVEGNRRLAAVRLLCDEALRQSVKATDLPAISRTAQDALRELPVVLYPDRRTLWAYLGFRHVNGSKPWDALSKAEFVARVHETYEVPLDEIAARIGDRHSTVSRFYRGYTVLSQAEDQKVFNRGDLWKNRFYFSHLYTALDQPEFKRFLGIRDSTVPGKNPVPRSKLKELEQLLTWLYGNRSTNTEPVVRTQNPDLNNLRRVIADPQALSLLRQGYGLEHAFEISQGDAARFRDALVRAKDAVQKAKGTLVTGYSGEQDLLSTMEDIVTTASSILQEMHQKDKSSTRRR